MMCYMNVFVCIFCNKNTDSYPITCDDMVCIPPDVMQKFEEKTTDGGATVEMRMIARKTKKNGADIYELDLKGLIEKEYFDMVCDKCQIAGVNSGVEGYED